MNRMNSNEPGLLSFRSLCLGLGTFCLVILAAAYSIEYFLHQSPCSLCLLQRYALWVVSALFLVAGLHNPQGIVRYAYLATTLIFSALGLALTLRQIWIQHLPKEAVPNCVADLERLFQFQPIWEVIKTVIMGGGECHETNFKILGLTLAEGGAIIFSGLILANLFLMFLKNKRRNKSAF